MAREYPRSPKNASQLQEAIDTFVRGFDYPDEIRIDYTVEGETKRTTIEVVTSDERASYELCFDGRRDGNEPELTRLD